MLKLIIFTLFIIHIQQTITNIPPLIAFVLQVDVSITNSYGETLIVTPSGKKAWPRQQKRHFVYHGETEKVKTYPGYRINVRLTDRVTLIQTFLVDHGKKSFTVEKKKRMVDNFEKKLTIQKKQAKYYDRQINHHYYRFTQILKQPVFVHNYTETGYKKIKMDEEVYQKLLNFYRTNYVHKRKEGVTHDELLVINKRSVSTMMIDISEEMKDIVHKYLMPVLHKWCKTKLQFNIAYGIREYYHGNVLYKHTDTVLTHVISAIINVDQDLAGEDWKLEVIGYDGIRKEITMKPGEIVLYESCKLIHGRPRMFEGRRYANIFYHYSPVKGWDYKIEGSEIVNPETSWREDLFDIKFNEEKAQFARINLDEL